MSPIAHGDGHDFPGLIDELVPSFAAEAEESFVGREDAVREPVVAHELPNVFDGVELGAFGRKGKESDVWRHDEAVGQMPPGLIEEKHRLGSWCDFGGDLGEMQAHRLGVAGGQDEGCSLALLWTDGAEDIGRGGSLIVRSRGPRTTPCPAPRDLVLLADAGLVREPDL